jgi:hypothetical protein
VNGHYRATEPQKIRKLGQLRQGVVNVIEGATYTPCLARKYTVSDLITGYGVAEAMGHCYARTGIAQRSFESALRQLV